jgi:hypothetical protein
MPGLACGSRGGSPVGMRRTTEKRGKDLVGIWAEFHHEFRKRLIKECARLAVRRLLGLER